MAVFFYNTLEVFVVENLLQQVSRPGPFSRHLLTVSLEQMW